MVFVFSGSAHESGNGACVDCVDGTPVLAHKMRNKSHFSKFYGANLRNLPKFIFRTKLVSIVSIWGIIVLQGVRPPLIPSDWASIDQHLYVGCQMEGVLRQLA